MKNSLENNTNFTQQSLPRLKNNSNHFNPNATSSLLQTVMNLPSSNIISKQAPLPTSTLPSTSQGFRPIKNKQQERLVTRNIHTAASNQGGSNTQTNNSAFIQHKNMTRSSSGILTAAQTLQNQYIARKIEVDLGSLPDFLEEAGGITKQAKSTSEGKRRNKKSNNAGNKKDVDESDDEKAQDEADDDKEVDLKKFKYTTPIDALKYEEDERRRQYAAKLIVQQIFKSNYGEEIDKFEEMSQRHLYYLRNQDDVIDPDNPLATFIKKNGRRTFKDKLKLLQDSLSDPFNFNTFQQLPSLNGKDQSTTYLSQQQQQQNRQNSKLLINNNNNPDKRRKLEEGENVDSSRHEDEQSKEVKIRDIKIESKSKAHDLNNVTLQLASPRSTRKIFEDTEGDIFTFRMAYFLTLKQRNADIAQLWKSYGCDNEISRKQNDSLYREYIDQQLKQSAIQQKKLKSYEHWKERKKKVVFTDPDYQEFMREYSELPKEEIFIIDRSTIVIYNQKIDSTFLVFTTLHFSSFESLQRVEMMKNQLNEGGAILLLEMIVDNCQQIRVLNFGFNKIGHRAISLIQKIVEERNLTTLGLRSVDLNTKQFCNLCIAMARNQTIEDLDVAENQLDERSIESIKAIIRYIKTIHRINVSKNLIPEQKLKELKKLLSDAFKTKEIFFF